MSGKFPNAVIAVVALTLAACASFSTSAPEFATPSASASPVARLMPVKEWPLRFRSHSFGVYCYDTFGCEVLYAGQLQLGQDKNKLQPSSASYGADYQRNWSGVHGMIANFPAPVDVRWRSKDGELRHARIDIANLFRDELIRHTVARNEMADVPDGRFRNEPAILMEVNDRTIRVYMRAHIPTKELQKPGNPYSDFRNDVILVRTYNY